METVYRGPEFDVEAVETTTSDGRAHRHEYVRLGDSTAILPLLPDGRVVLVRQYRVPPARQLLEIPAGMLEEGESPEDGAARELREETGYRCGRLRRIARFLPAPGKLTEWMSLFVAKDLVAGDACPDEDEEFQVEVLSREEARLCVERGEIADAKTLLALALWDQGQGTDGGG